MLYYLVTNGRIVTDKTAARLSIDRDIKHANIYLPRWLKIRRSKCMLVTARDFTNSFKREPGPWILRVVCVIAQAAIGHMALHIMALFQRGGFSKESVTTK